MVELCIIAGFLFLLAIGDILFTTLMFFVNKFGNRSHMRYFQYLKSML